MTTGRLSVIMVEWDSGWPLGPKLCVASRVFERDVLRILLSEFHKGQEEHTLGIKERSNGSPMFIINMRAENDWRTDMVA